MRLREQAKRLLALYCEFEHHEPAIVLVVGSPHKTRHLAPFAELDDGVVSKAHHLGDVGDGNQGVVGSSGYLQHELVLLWLQSGSGSGLLTELQKPPDLRSKFGQQLNLVAVGFSGHRFHARSIVTRYNLQLAIMEAKAKYGGLSTPVACATSVEMRVPGA
jgi:hypothetical protein